MIALLVIAAVVWFALRSMGRNEAGRLENARRMRRESEKRGDQ